MSADRGLVAVLAEVAALVLAASALVPATSTCSPQKDTAPVPRRFVIDIPVEASDGPRPPEPWPPDTFDAAHWLGPVAGPAHPFLVAKNEPVASAGCPFAPMVIPACPEGITALSTSSVHQREELFNRVITVAGLLRAPGVLRAEPPRAGERATQSGRVWIGDLGLLDGETMCYREPCPPPESRFGCYGDETGLCCGVPFERRVVARGRLQSGLYHYIYKPLICDLGDRNVRVDSLPTTGGRP